MGAFLPPWRCDMKCSVWLLVLAVALTALAAPVQAGPRGRKAPNGDSAAKGRLTGEYAVMAKVLNLTEAKQALLAEMIEACAADAELRQRVNAMKLAQLNRQLAEAGKSDDKDAIKAINRQIKALETEDVSSRAGTMTAVMGLLTSEQKQQWANYSVYRRIAPRFKRADLTEEQDKKVRDLCSARAAAILAKDARGQAEAYKDLAAAIAESILTDEQKALMTDKVSRKERKAGAGAESGLRGEYAVMDRVLNFTDDQKARLTEALKARAEQAETWRKADAEFRKQFIEAKKSKDTEAFAKVLKERKAVTAERAKTRGSTTAVVTELLTPAQKKQWAGYTVYRKIAPRFKRADLTDEQDKKVLDICTAKAADFSADSRKVRGEAYKDLTTAIVDGVLTAEQKEKVTGKTRKKESRKDKKKIRVKLGATA